MPTQHGESAVIRLLPRDRGVLSIDKLGCSAVRRDDAEAAACAAPWHDRRDRTDRKRQDHHAGHAAVDPQRADAENSHHRGSGRIRDRRHQSIASETRDRTDIRGRSARLRASGSGRHHGGRGARRRNRAYRNPCGADRPSGSDHAAHRDRRRRGAAADRSRRRGLPAALDAARGDRPAPGPPALRPLQDAAAPDAGRSRGRSAPRRARPEGRRDGL